MTRQDTTTTVEIHNDVYWPDEAQLADFAEQAVRAEQADRAEKTDRTLENNDEYTALYFVQ